MVIINEINGAEGTVLFNFANHTAYSVPVIRVIFLVQCHTIVSHGYQSAALWHIKAYTLMHDGIQIFRLVCASGLGIAIGNPVDREKGHRVCPVITVFRGHQESLWGRNMLVRRIGKIMHIELSVPISQHGLMIVCPSIAVIGCRMFPVGTHHLNIVYPYHGWQLPVMTGRVRQLRACIVYSILRRYRKCQRTGCCKGKKLFQFHLFTPMLFFHLLKWGFSSAWLTCKQAKLYKTTNFFVSR